MGRISELTAMVSQATTDIFAFAQSGVRTFRETRQQLAEWIVRTGNTFLQAGTGASAEPVQTALRRFDFAPEQFGAVGDGVTDDSTAWQRAITAAIANKGNVRCLSNSYAIATGLIVNGSGISIKGRGAYSPHDVGSLASLPMLKWTGAAGGTMMTVAPTEGASAQRLDAVDINLSFDGNSLAAKGLLVKSIRNSRINIYVQETTGTGFHMDVATTLGETGGCNYNEINVNAKHLVNSGVGIRLSGLSSYNTAFNLFKNIYVIHNNGAGIVAENVDNNIWLNTALFRAASGTGDGIVWQGGADTLTCARNETFFKLSCNSTLQVKGTGAYAVAATDIRIYDLDTHNYPSVLPTLEAGATAYWRDNEHTPIAFSATDSSGTTYNSGTQTDITFNTETFDPGADFASPTYTAPMPGKYLFTLRLFHTSGVTVGDKWVFRLVTSNRTYNHHYVVHTADTGTVCYTVLADMDAGDTAKWTIQRGGGAGNFILAGDTELNSFSGHMVDGV